MPTELAPNPQFVAALCALPAEELAQALAQAGLLEDAKALILGERCQEDFELFVREFWACVPGVGPLVWNWHLAVFCQELHRIALRVEAGLPKKHDLIFNVPPGTSKSTISSVLFVCWVWSWFPQARFICVTHTDSLARDLASKCRDVVMSEKYQACCPHVQVRPDRSAVHDFELSAGGGRKSSTVGGVTPTGRHAHFVLIDDPIDPQGARSEVELDTAAKFMTEVIPTRVVDKGVCPTVLIMQRLHPRDPTRVMLDVGLNAGTTPIRHICLPGELGGVSAAVSPPELETNYRDGLLDPERLPRRVLQDLAARLGPWAYAGQVGQNPMPPGGGMFEREWFVKRVKAAPYDARRVRYWDRADTADGGCATAGVLMSKDSQGKYYVEHVAWGQWEFHKRNKAILGIAHRDRDRYAPRHAPGIWVEGERGSTGKEAFASLATLLDGFPIREDLPTGSKDTRADPWAAQLAAGNVYLVDDGTWDVHAYVEEHLQFRPEAGKRLGKFKDRVDASSGAWAKLATGAGAGGKLLRVVQLGPGRGQAAKVRVVACAGPELVALRTDNKCLLVWLQDPAAGDLCPVTVGAMAGAVHNLGTVPGHGLVHLLGSLGLVFCDLDPKDLQEQWQAPLAPWGAPPVELVMQRAHGKGLWGFLLRQWAPAPEVVVFASPGGKRALSCALAFADALRLPRSTVFRPGREAPCQPGEKAPNEHVYFMTKLCRGMVV